MALKDHLEAPQSADRAVDEALLRAAVLSLTRQIQQLTEVVEAHENLIGLLWDDFRARRPVDKG